MASAAHTYFVGSATFDRPGEAVDHARAVARQLAQEAAAGRNVDVVRDDGERVRIRGFLDSRGRPTTITIPKPGRRW